MSQLTHQPLRPQAQGTGVGRSRQAELREAPVAENWPFTLAEFQGWICRAVLNVSEPDG